MPAPNIDSPDLAKRLAYAHDTIYRTYEAMCERFLKDAEFRAERNGIIDPGTINRWVTSARFPEHLPAILNRILREDGVPDRLADEFLALQQIEPLGMIEFQKEVVEAFLDLAQKHPTSSIDFCVAPGHLQSTAAWIGEIDRRQMIHRVGTIKCKTTCPPLMLALELDGLIAQDYLEGFVANFWTIRDILDRNGGKGSITIVGHFPRIPPFHGAIMGVNGMWSHAWVERWEADDEGRLSVDTSWIRRLSPQPPTQGLFNRLVSLFDDDGVRPITGISEPPSRFAESWRRAIIPQLFKRFNEWMLQLSLHMNG